MTVALFSSRSKAEPTQQRLVESGIPAEIHDELRLERLWFVGRPPIVRLEVPAAQFERAYQKVVEWSPQAAMSDVIRCPECCSLRIDYPLCSHKSVLPNLVVGFLATLGHVNTGFYCHDCHFTWPREGTQVARARPHMAPYYFIDGGEQPHLPKEPEVKSHPMLH